MTDQQKTPLSIKDAIAAFIPIENIGSQDYASFRRAITEIKKELDNNPDVFAGTKFRSVLDGIIKSEDDIPRLYTVTTKDTSLNVNGLKRDYYNMAIEISTGSKGEVLRIGRFDADTFDPKVDSNTYGIALVADGEVKAGIAVSPRTGDNLSSAPGVEIIVKGDE